MAPLMLEGDTLGQRHRHYNILVTNACNATPSVLQKINYEDNDINNMLKIDVANKNQDVEFILEVMQSEDLLYVSRAIKHCAWLITDERYAHIINPDYINSNLFPKMTSSAISKLLLHIRLHLKKESRVEIFYNYYKDKDIDAALKWLPYCSIGLIEKEVESHIEKLEGNMHLFKRLCERSITILDICVKKSAYHKKEMITAANFWIHSETERYLDVKESVKAYYNPCLNAKSTDVVMKQCPQRIMDNFEKYADYIDLKTFVKYVKKEDIKEFLLKHVQNEKLRAWYKFENLKHFIVKMPKEGRFEFLKHVFIEKTHAQEKEVAVPLSSDSRLGMLCCASSSPPQNSSANIYRWYRFAPFHVAFPDLKKLIRAESVPAERTAMLAVLVSCAGQNIGHIQSLLQYFHDKHINEPFKFKIQFINVFLSEVKCTHKFDVKTWNTLSNIFKSMEVYIEADNNVQSCIQSIIIYHVLRDDKVPEIIESKLRFSELKLKPALYSDEEEKKIFNYLHNFLVNKLESVTISNEIEMNATITALYDVITLIQNWKKELSDYPLVLNKIKELAKIKKQNGWYADLKPLYNKNKTWRKLMFEESLVISPSENACLNALKHDPELLTRYKGEVVALCSDDSVSLRQLLNKLRIYWQDRLAEWQAAYLGRLEQTGGHKALVTGICTLLPPQPLIGILNKYAPTNMKINWSEEDELVLSLRKHLAKKLYLARPLLSAETVLMYAQGDYLQYALPSVNSIINNVSAVRSRDHIPRFIDAPVSLQKHGIRLAFNKLNTGELKEMFSDLWKSTKNLSIRAVLFKKTYDLLCKEKDPKMIESIWEILSIFIDNLSPDDNKVIFYTLSKVNKVPEIVRGKFCVKSYTFLKTLPTKANCEQPLIDVINSMPDTMESLDANFVSELLFDSIDSKFIDARYQHLELMVSYFLCAKNEESQMQAYESFLKPLLQRSLALWNVEIDKNFNVRHNVRDLLTKFCTHFTTKGFFKGMLFPVRMFEDIQKLLEEHLPVAKHYTFITNWKLTVCFVKLLEGCKDLIAKISQSFSGYHFYDKTWNEVYLKIFQEFAKSCLQLLREDVRTYFSSITPLFTEALNIMFSNFNMGLQNYIDILKYLLEDQDFIEGCLVALYLLPRHPNATDEDYIKVKEIRNMLLSHTCLEVKMHYFEKFDMIDEYEDDGLITFEND